MHAAKILMDCRYS